MRCDRVGIHQNKSTGWRTFQNRGSPYCWYQVSLLIAGDGCGPTRPGQHARSCQEPCLKRQQLSPLTQCDISMYGNIMLRLVCFFGHRTVVHRPSACSQRGPGEKRPLAGPSILVWGLYSSSFLVLGMPVNESRCILFSASHPWPLSIAFLQRCVSLDDPGEPFR